MQEKNNIFDINEDDCRLVRETLQEVITDLQAQGYNPITQLVGYLSSGDPGYISSNNNARDKILLVERSKILSAVLKEYLDK